MVSRQEAQNNFDNIWQQIISVLALPSFSEAFEYCSEIFLGGSLIDTGKPFTEESDIDLFLLLNFNPLEEKIPSSLLIVLVYLNLLAKQQQVPLHVSFAVEKLKEVPTQTLLLRPQRQSRT